MHPSGLFLCNNKIKYGTMYEIKQVNPRGNQLWIFIGRTDAEAEAPLFWSPEMNSRLMGKTPWCWERLRAEGEEGARGWDSWMASLMQWIWTWANSRRWWGTGKTGVLSPWDCKESDMTGQLNNCLIHSPYSSSINYSNTVFYNYFFLIQDSIQVYALHLVVM